LKQRPIDIDLVKEVLKHMIRHTVKEDIPIEEIVKIVCAKLGVKIADIKSLRKNKNIAFARQIAMYLARKLTPASFPDIGEKIGKRDHSTVIYAYNKIEKLLETDAKCRELIEEIEEAINRNI
jgi:chromosomal replication initiator protein